TDPSSSPVSVDGLREARQRNCGRTFSLLKRDGPGRERRNSFCELGGAGMKKRTSHAGTCYTTIVSSDPNYPGCTTHRRWYTDDVEISLDGGPIDLHSVSIKISNVDRKVQVYIVTAELFSQHLADREPATREKALAE